MILKKYKKSVVLALFLFLLSLPAISQDVVVYKAKKIYLCDTNFDIVHAMAVQGDKIVLTGTLDSAMKLFPNAKIIDYGKKVIYPGFIDAHCHFYGYAKGLNECNLIGTKSEAEAIKRVSKFAKKNTNTWIVGRGWDQNDWAGSQYPTKESLDKAFPNTPVCLKRIDGHAAWVNSAALRAIKLDPNTKVPGGEILMKNGEFMGILIDNAVDLVTMHIPDIPLASKIQSIKTAANICYANGLTTIDDAGLYVKEMLFLDSLQFRKIVKLRMYAMLNDGDESLAWIAQNGIYKTARMHVSSVKFYLDGAMGSRGALLKKDYCDRGDWKGLLLTNELNFSNTCRFLFSHGYQACVHAIGDSANKIALRTYTNLLPPGMDMRWRIEHAQILDPADRSLLRGRSIILSVQPTHATSDAPWIEKRLCAQRMAGAYAYKSLLNVTGILALGTDFPVESISPIRTFYSAVTRLDGSGLLKEPFRINEALNRQEALLGMTIWTAIANLEEYEKGSLETGKLADFVVCNQDLMTVPDKKIMKTKIVATYIGNELVYKK